MSLLDSLVGKIAPYNCLACGNEGQLLCAVCVDKLPAVPERCYSCCRPSPGWLTCARCARNSRLESVRAGTVYEGVAKDLVWKLKLSGARASARIMAVRLAPLVGREPGTLIVPVPTATGRVRRRGYDQARLLARELSRRTRLPYRDCLFRRGQTHQHGLSRSERQTQLSAAFRVKRNLKGSNVILIDDVITTGATLEAAAAALLAAGAGRIDAAIFASTETKAI